MEKKQVKNQKLTKYSFIPELQRQFFNGVYSTVVGDYLKIMKTTLDLYQAFKQHETRKHGNKEKLLIKKASL